MPEYLSSQGFAILKSGFTHCPECVTPQYCAHISECREQIRPHKVSRDTKEVEVIHIKVPNCSYKANVRCCRFPEDCEYLQKPERY